MKSKHFPTAQKPWHRHGDQPQPTFKTDVPVPQHNLPGKTPDWIRNSVEVCEQSHESRGPV